MPTVATITPGAVEPHPARTESTDLPRLAVATLPETDEEQPSSEPVPKSILVVDIGGTKVKVLVSGQVEPRKHRSGSRLTPTSLIKLVKELADGWEYEAVSIGYPGLVGDNGPRSEPGNLGPGWVGFDYAAAFGLPVRVVNDAAMQALGSYEGGRMLFLGLGTGVGSALIAENVLVNLELGELPEKEGRVISEVLGSAALKRLGKKAWREAVARIIPALMRAFVADYVVLGGGNAKELKELPHGARRGHNLTAFRGGFRLWHLDDAPTLSSQPGLPAPASQPDWRLV